MSCSPRKILTSIVVGALQGISTLWLSFSHFSLFRILTPSFEIHSLECLDSRVILVLLLVGAVSFLLTPLRDHRLPLSLGSTFLLTLVSLETFS